MGWLLLERNLPRIIWNCVSEPFYMETLQGQFLVAPPGLTEPNFHRTIVLVLQHDENGALGLVINRPTNSEIDNIWEVMTGTSLSNEGVLYIGGPVEGPIMLLHTRAEYSEQQVMPGLYVSSRKTNLSKLVSEKALPYKVFSGYAGWAEGQLDAELQQGGWLVAPASPEDIFSMETSDPWKSLCQRLGRAVLRTATGQDHIPPNPEIN